MSDISFNGPDGKEDELLDDLLSEKPSNKNVSPPSTTALDFPDLLVDDGKPQKPDMIPYRRSIAVDTLVQLETLATSSCDEQTTSKHSRSGSDETQDPIEATPTTDTNKSLQDKISESLKAIATFRKKKDRHHQEKEEVEETSNERGSEHDGDSPRSIPVTTQSKQDDPKDPEMTKIDWEDAIKAMDEENKKIENEKLALDTKRMEIEKQKQSESTIKQLE